MYDRVKGKKFFETDYYLTQFLTSHGKFNKYLKRFHIKESEFCDHCPIEEESVEHIIFHCDKHFAEREELKAHIGTDTSWPCDLKYFMNQNIFYYFKQFCNNVFK